MLEGDASAAYAARQIFFDETRVEVMRDWRFRTRWGDLKLPLIAPRCDRAPGVLLSRSRRLLFSRRAPSGMLTQTDCSSGSCRYGGGTRASGHVSGGD
jgi:hypothetical protein